MEIKEQRFNITSADGFALDALLLLPQGERKGAILFSGGTGIRKEYYLKMASWIAAEGYAVLLYDYRGVGGSRPARLRGFRAGMTDWGLLDMNAAWEEIQQRFAGLPLYLLGHSMGGQLTGLLQKPERISGMVNIAASTGNWRHFLPPQKYFTFLVMYGYFPLVTRLTGYGAASWIRLGEDLPREVARDWARWCRNPHYFRYELVEDPLLPGGRYAFGQITCPMETLYFSDDYIATPQTVQEMMAYFTAADIRITRYTPGELGKTAIGHLGLFRSANKDLWPLVLRHLEYTRQRMAPLLASA